jgi:serine/threonine protein kinase
MSMVSVASLVETLCRHRLLEPEQIEELRRELKDRFPEPYSLAGELVRRGWLTTYQVNQLTQDRGPQLRLGKYVLLERLGKGGMGQVFKARDHKRDRLVALKVLRKEYVSNPLALQRFCREAHAVSQMAHPNIVLAYEAGQVGSVPFLAMEYVEGTDLRRLVLRAGPLPIAQACDYIRQAALGLQHAHERGVVHRDVKPRNLVLTRTGTGGTAVIKVLDFGLARLESEAGGIGRLTRLGRVVGTAEYMAPEQAENCRDADARADVYSLGCSLFFLLVGRPPFEAEDRTEGVNLRLEREPPPILQLRAEVPPALAEVLARMLARAADERYQTPAAVARALQPFCPAGVPDSTPSAESAADTDAREVASFPPTRPRRPGLALALAGAVVLLLGTVALVVLHPFAPSRSQQGGRKGKKDPQSDKAVPPLDSGERKKREEVEEEPQDKKDAGEKKRRKKPEEVEEEPAKTDKSDP